MFKNNVYIVVVLAVANGCWGAVHERSSEQKKVASMHMIKPKHPVPGIRGLPEGMGEGFMLLLQGYQVTGPCIADMRARTEVVLESLRSPQLPAVIIKLALDYFAPEQNSETIRKALENNWWALFEKHIGKPSLCSDEVVVSPEVSELFMKKLGSGYNEKVVERTVITSCLRDLQALAKLGMAYNPYAYIIRREMNKPYDCLHCATCIESEDSERFWFGLNPTKFWKGNVSLDQALVNASAAVQRTRIICEKCRKDSFVTARIILVERPQLFMIITHYGKAFNFRRWHDAPEKLEHSGATFELCGLVMEHGFDKIDTSSDPHLYYPMKQRVVHLRGFSHGYHTQKLRFLSEDYLKGLGGEFATQAMLYRYAGPMPRPRARDTTTCHCIIS